MNKPYWMLGIVPLLALASVLVTLLRPTTESLPSQTSTNGTTSLLALDSVAFLPISYNSSQAKVEPNQSFPLDQDVVVFTLFNNQIGNDEYFEDEQTVEQARKCELEQLCGGKVDMEVEELPEKDWLLQPTTSPGDWKRPDTKTFCEPHQSTLTAARQICDRQTELADHKTCALLLKDFFSTYSNDQICSFLVERITPVGYFIQQHHARHSSGDHTPVDFSSFPPHLRLSLEGTDYGVFYLQYDQASYSGLSLTNKEKKRFTGPARGRIEAALKKIGYPAPEIATFVARRDVTGIQRRVVHDHANSAIVAGQVSRHYRLVVKESLSLLSVAHTYSPLPPSDPSTAFSDFEIALTMTFEHLSVVLARSMFNGKYLSARKAALGSSATFLELQSITLNREVALEAHHFEPKALLYLGPGRFPVLGDKRIGNGRLFMPGAENHCLYDTSLRIPIPFSTYVQEQALRGMSYVVKTYVSFSQSKSREFRRRLTAQEEGDDPFIEFKPVLPADEDGSYVLVAIVICLNPGSSLEELVATTIHYEDDEDDAGKLLEEEAKRWRAWLFHTFWDSSQSLGKQDAEAVAAQVKEAATGNVDEGEEDEE